LNPEVLSAAECILRGRPVGGSPKAPNVLSLSALSQLGDASVVATKRELAMYMAQVKFYLDSIAVPA